MGRKRSAVFGMVVTFQALHHPFSRAEPKVLVAYRDQALNLVVCAVTCPDQPVKMMSLETVVTAMDLGVIHQLLAKSG